MAATPAIEARIIIRGARLLSGQNGRFGVSSTDFEFCEEI